MTETITKCESCEEAIKDAENTAQYGSLTHKILCQSCYESDTENASTVTRFTNVHGDKIEQVIFGEHTCYSGTIEEIYDSEAPQWFLDLFNNEFKGRHWVRSDAWRGYFDTTKNMTGVVELVCGWMTGDYSDVPHKRDSHTFFVKLSEGEIVPPKSLYVLFEPTSNVFSTATTYLTKAEDAEEIKAWIESQVDLHSALS
jgi:hypothetical protein